LIDPLTGGGILNGCLSGKLAGEAAATAVAAGDASLESLSPYERRWRGRLEEELARHYLIKERLLRLDDETVNRAIRAIVDAKVDRVTGVAVLAAIRAREPGLLAVFEGLL
jgi:digeranylgeranylglycerophospholipid reductase